MNKDCFSERYHSEPNLHDGRIIGGRLCESYRSEPNLHHCRVDAHCINTSVTNMHHCTVNDEHRFERCRSESYLLHFRINMAGMNEIYRSEPKLHHYYRKTDDGLPNRTSSGQSTKVGCYKPQVLRPNEGYSALQRSQRVILGGNYNLTKSEMILRSRNTPSVECNSKENAQMFELCKIDYGFSNERSPGYTRKPGCSITTTSCSNNDKSSLQLAECVITDGNNNLINSDMTRGQKNIPSLEYISQENSTISELRHYKMDHGFSSEISFDHTPKAGDIHIQLPSSNNGYYCEDYAQHLPGCVILDENDYLSERNMIFAPRKTPSMESINKQNIPIPRLSNGTSGGKRLFEFRRSFIRYLSSCVNPRTEI